MNLDPTASASASASTFSFVRGTLPAPLKPDASDRAVSPTTFYLPSPPQMGRRRGGVGPLAIVLASAGLHVLLALSVSRAGANEAPRLRGPNHVRVTVRRPPPPLVKPVESPPPAVTPPPKPRTALPKKNVVQPPAPAPSTVAPPPEAPPPAEPMLATTAATEPGAVVGSAQGSVSGTGVEGGVRGGAGSLVAASPPAPIIQAHEGAGYLRNPRPQYPEMARARGWEGEVVLKVRVAASGHPEAVAVKRSSGRRLLDEAAIEAVRGWAFVPASQGGAAMAGWVEVPLVFKLQ